MFLQDGDNPRSFECQWYMTRGYETLDYGGDEREMIFSEQVVRLHDRMVCKIFSVDRLQNCTRKKK